MGYRTQSAAKLHPLLWINGWNIQIERIVVKPNFLEVAGKQTPQHLVGAFGFLKVRLTCQSLHFGKISEMKSISKHH